MCDQIQNQIFETSSNLCNVMVIIPVRDEETTIAKVIRDLQSFGLTKIRVVDNGSSDRTAVETWLLWLPFLASLAWSWVNYQSIDR